MKNKKIVRKSSPKNLFVFWIEGDKLCRFRLDYFLDKYCPGASFDLALQKYCNDRNVPIFSLDIKQVIQMHPTKINLPKLLGINFSQELPFVLNLKPFYL